MKRDKLIGYITLFLMVFVFLAGIQTAIAKQISFINDGVLVKQNLNYDCCDHDLPNEFYYELKPISSGCPNVKDIESNNGVYTFSMTGSNCVKTLEFDLFGIPSGMYKYQLRQIANDVPSDVKLDDGVYDLDIYVSNGTDSQFILHKSTDEVDDNLKDDYKLDCIEWNVDYVDKTLNNQDHKSSENLPGGLLLATGDLVNYIIPASAILMLLGSIFMVLSYKTRS